MNKVMIYLLITYLIQLINKISLILSIYSVPNYNYGHNYKAKSLKLFIF